MTKISVQLHGLPGELIQFACQSAMDHDLQLAAAKLFPEFMVRLVEDEEHERLAAHPDQVDMILFYLSKPDLSARSLHDFMGKNPDGLVLRLGRLEDNGLGESVLSARTDNPDSLRIWKSVVKRIRAITTAGAWVVNPTTGARTYSKSHRYTEAALHLEADGTAMRPVAGWNNYEFASVPGETKSR